MLQRNSRRNALTGLLAIANLGGAVALEARGQGLAATSGYVSFDTPEILIRVGF